MTGEALTLRVTLPMVTGVRGKGSSNRPIGSSRFASGGNRGRFRDRDHFQITSQGTVLTQKCVGKFARTVKPALEANN
jgi:hypothetical protein